MLKSYFKLTIRSFLTNKVFSLINLGGLAIGIASFVYIAIYIQGEISYDKHWPESENIYRVSESVEAEDKISDFALSPLAIGPSLKEKFPWVESQTILSYPRKQRVKYKNKAFDINSVSYSDEHFFELFPHHFLEGSPINTLKEPNTTVISKKIKELFFGNSPAIGKTLELPTGKYTIKGVIEARGESHIKPEILISIYSIPQKTRDNSYNSDWTYLFTYSYIKFKDTKGLNETKSQMPTWQKETIDPWIEKNELTYKLHFHFQNIKDIHFTTNLDYDFKTNINSKQLYTLGFVAIFLLIIASINYMNLATARSAKRIKEIAIRKVSGARKRQLVYQFIGEALVFSFLSFIIGLLLLEILLPFLNSISGNNINIIGHMFGNALFFPFILCVLSLIGIVSGIYPAFILSGFTLARTLKGTYNFKKNPKSSLNLSEISRKGLVIFQFSISIGMIICTLITSKQMKFLKSQELGFDKERILILDVPKDTVIRNNIKALKAELTKISGIKHVSTSLNLPGFRHGRLTFYIDNQGKYEQQMINVFCVNHDFAKTLNLKIQEGRFFDEAHPGDSEHSFVVNEAAKKILGEKPIGRKLSCGYNVNGKIIGIVKDFNYNSLHQPIKPLILLLKPKNIAYITAKISSNDIKGTIGNIKAAWSKFDSSIPPSYKFLDESFNSLYEKEEKQMKLFGYFATLTILISCMGILALAGFTAEQRTKEVGIRKSMGASPSSIIVLFGKQFIKWIVLSNIIAWPISWYMMNKWLQNFAYRTDLTIWSFLLSMGIALIIAAITISFQTYKTATCNPSNTLRYE